MIFNDTWPPRVHVYVVENLLKVRSHLLILHGHIHIYTQAHTISVLDNAV